ncbi:HAD-IA family hydrolase [Candidatus Bathyarchaeota archaeon]|nr:HAD-IA family hydrolase [Candidatus Bathyarchaeota archaeon]
MIKAVVFDVDGVLIDSNETIIQAYEKTAEKRGLRIPSPQEIIDLMGRPLVEIVRILWPNVNVELFTKDFRRLFMDEDLVVPAIKGAVEIVKEIRESGLRIGAISGKIMFFIERHLKEAGFNINWFEAVVSFETTKKHKPDPEPLLYAINRLGVQPTEAVYVGDSISDYECAKNAEVEYVAVLTGSLNREDLKKLKVKNVIDSVAALPDLLRNTLARGQIDEPH